MNTVEEVRNYETNERIFIIIIDQTRTEIRITEQEQADDPEQNLGWLLAKKFIDKVRDGTARNEAIIKKFLEKKTYFKFLSAGG